MNAINFCLVAITTVHTTNAFSLLKFGLEEKDTELESGDEVHSVSIYITSFKYYKTEYSKLFVNSNGALSFESNFSHYSATLSNLPKMTTSPPIIAPFWSDVDLTNGGSVWYRQSTKKQDLKEVTSKICSSFTAAWVFIATWEKVRFYNASDEDKRKKNTFQVVLATDISRSRSYVIFGYKMLDWTTDADYVRRGDRDTHAIAGFDAGNGRTFVDLPGSFTEDVAKLNSSSNSGSPGKWLYSVADTPVPAAGCQPKQENQHRLEYIEGYCRRVRIVEESSSTREPGRAPSNAQAKPKTTTKTTIKACPSGTFGRKCWKCHCKEDCDKTTGSCKAGCLPGWKGGNCQQECSECQEDDDDDDDDDEPSFFESTTFKIVGASLAAAATVVSSVGIASMFTGSLQSVLPFQNPFAPNTPGNASGQGQQQNVENTDGEAKNVKKKVTVDKKVLGGDSSSSSDSSEESSDKPKDNQKRCKQLSALLGCFGGIFMCIILKCLCCIAEKRRKRLSKSNRRRTTHAALSLVIKKSSKNVKKGNVCSRFVSKMLCCRSSKKSQEHETLEDVTSESSLTRSLTEDTAMKSSASSDVTKSKASPTNTEVSLPIDKTRDDSITLYDRTFGSIFSPRKSSHSLSAGKSQNTLPGTPSPTNAELGLPIDHTQEGSKTLFGFIFSSPGSQVDSGNVTKCPSRGSLTHPGSPEIKPSMVSTTDKELDHRENITEDVQAPEDTKDIRPKKICCPVLSKLPCCRCSKCAKSSKSTPSKGPSTNKELGMENENSEIERKRSSREVSKIPCCRCLKPSKSSKSTPSIDSSIELDMEKENTEVTKK